MNPGWVRQRFAEARVARLATVAAAGVPHLVPIVFVLIGDSIWSAVDQKPKSTTALRRLDNIRANAAVSVLIDDYRDDWDRLWWARADGLARVGAVPAAVVDALAAKYPQYMRQPPAGLAIEVAVSRWSGWAASDAGGQRSSQASR